MIIVCSPDTKYIRHCAVMLRSLYDSNPGADISVYIIHSRTDGNERVKLMTYLATFLDTVSYIQIDPALASGLPMVGHLTSAAYYRLFLPSILPSTVEKVLYLDCDLLVVDSLNDLWNISLGDQLLAAVIDRSQQENRQRLSLRQDSSYFNSGVLLLNMALLRKSDIIPKGLIFAKRMGEAAYFADQDILNYLFQDGWMRLHSRWNALPHLWGLDGSQSTPEERTSQEMVSAQTDPAIVHFAGGGPAKPWHYACSHPWKNKYIEIKNKTPWASIPLEEAPLPWYKSMVRQSVFRAKCMAKNAMNSLSAGNS
jgi:lipopolysaccharide biosynthesis glycosyltransferase